VYIAVMTEAVVILITSFLTAYRGHRSYTAEP